MMSTLKWTHLGLSSVYYGTKVWLGFNPATLSWSLAHMSRLAGLRTSRQQATTTNLSRTTDGSTTSESA